MILKLSLIAALGYLMGSLSGGILISKAFGLRDIRGVGSGNAGTTNVLRTLGWIPSVLTLVFDALKAYLAAMLGKWIGGTAGLLVGGLFAMAGHIWPVYFRFHGGKGIAAALGMIFAMSPLIAVTLFLAEILIVGTTRYMSVASLSNVILFPAATVAVFHASPDAALYIGFSIAGALLVLYAHRGNLRRLLRHEENKLDFSRIKSGTKKKD